MGLCRGFFDSIVIGVVDHLVDVRDFLLGVDLYDAYFCSGGTGYGFTENGGANDPGDIGENTNYMWGGDGGEGTSSGAGGGGATGGDDGGGGAGGGARGRGGGGTRVNQAGVMRPRVDLNNNDTLEVDRNAAAGANQGAGNNPGGGNAGNNAGGGNAGSNSGPSSGVDAVEGGRRGSDRGVFIRRFLGATSGFREPFRNRFEGIHEYVNDSGLLATDLFSNEYREPIRSAVPSTQAGVFQGGEVVSGEGVRSERGATMVADGGHGGQGLNGAWYSSQRGDFDDSAS